MKRLNFDIFIIIIKAMLILMTGLLFVPGSVTAQERLSVNSGIANMRSGPGTKNDVLWQVEQYHPFRIIEKKGNWYKVKDFEKDIAWIHKSLLGKTKSVITKAPPPPKKGKKPAKVKYNIRAKPSIKSKILYEVGKGVPFKVLKQKGNWIKIEHADGDGGWIYKTLVW